MTQGTIVRQVSPGKRRIIRALAQKDITDALKNKNTLTLLICVGFMMLFYRYMSGLQTIGQPPALLVYSDGDSALLDELDLSPEVSLRVYDSQTRLEQVVAGGEDAAFGLVLPSDLEAQLATDAPLVLEGVAGVWLDEAVIAEQVSPIEEELSYLAGRPVTIHIANEARVGPDMETAGLPVLAGLSVIFALVMVGVSLVPHLMIEEKQTKTIDALRVSPATAGEIVTGKALAGLFYGLTAVALMVLFYAQMITQWWLLALAAFAGSLFVVAVGLVLGMLVNDRQVFLLVAWFVVIPLLIPTFLSLMTDLVPQWLVTIFHWIPTVALFRLVRMSFTSQMPWQEIGTDLGLLLASAMLLLAVAAWLVRRADRV